MSRSFASCLSILLLALAGPVLAGAGYTTQTRNYTVDAIQRSTLHSYPTGGSAQPLPLVIVLHGDGGTAAGIRAALPLEAQANGAAAFSYLSSAGGSFEYWTDTGRGHEGRFVQAVIANYGVAGITIDPARVYLVGFSGGGTMAQALGCRLGAGVIRKMGIHSGSLYSVGDFTYTGNGGVSCNLPGTMLVWGMLDQTKGVDYATGQAIRNNHLATQNCAATTTNTTPAPCVAYDQCTRPVEWCAIDGLAHALWSQSAQAFWRYFAEDGVAGPETPLFEDGFDGGLAPPASPRWVMGYHVGYERHLLATADIDFASITHLMVGRLIPNADATLTDHFDIDPVNGPIWAQGVIDAAQAANRKAILMIGGAGEIAGWRAAAASPASRATFVANLLAKVDQYGADGLDLDWEPIDTQDQAPLLALAQALRAQRPNLLLTMPVGWINTNLSPPTGDAAFMDAMADVLDRIAVMSYGMVYEDFGWWSWHSSALAAHKGNTPSSVTASINYYLGAGVPAAKLAVGTGFYGTCYQRVTAPDQVTQGDDIVGSDGTFSYRNIVANYLPGMSANYDAAASAPWLSSAGGVGPVGARCNYLTYENAASIAAKGNYVRAQGLGGTIIWTIAQGHRPDLPVGDPNQLLRAVKAGFLD